MIRAASEVEPGKDEDSQRRNTVKKSVHDFSPFSISYVCVCGVA